MKFGHYLVETRLQGVINSILPYALSILDKLISGGFTGFERAEPYLIIGSWLVMHEPRYKQQEFHSSLTSVRMPISNLIFAVRADPGSENELISFRLSPHILRDRGHAGISTSCQPRSNASQQKPLSP